MPNRSERRSALARTPLSRVSRGRSESERMTPDELAEAGLRYDVSGGRHGDARPSRGA